MEVNEIKSLIEDTGKANHARVKALEQKVAEIESKGAVSSETKAQLEKITTDLVSLTEIKTRQDRIETALNRRQVVDERGAEIPAERVEHRKAYDRYVRKGKDENLGELEKKALSVTSDPDGGYTAPVELDHQITRVVTEISDIRSLAQVMTIGAPSLKKLVNRGGTAAGWVGELQARPQTDASTLSALEFPAMELYAMPAASQTLLDDSFVNIEEWIAQEVGIAFAQAEGAAFIDGNGLNKPKGLLGGTLTEADAAGDAAWGGTAFIKTGVNGALPSTNPGDEYKKLIALKFALRQSYRAGASYVLNRTTLGMVMGLTDANGQPLWRPGMTAGAPSLLNGDPVNEISGLPEMSSNGYAMGYGNWQRHYLIVDRVGVRVLRDPFTAKPHVLFYTTKRVGGGIQMFEAAKWLKFAA